MKNLIVKKEIETLLYEIKSRREMDANPAETLGMVQNKIEKLLNYTKRDYIITKWNNE